MAQAIKEAKDISELKIITENFHYKISNLEILKTKVKDYKDSGFFVYVLLDANDNVLYVGKTKDLFSRLTTHIKEEKIDDWNKNISRICFYNFESETDQSIVEIYLINLLQGTYNVSSKKDLPKHILELQPFESLTYKQFQDFKFFSKTPILFSTSNDNSKPESNDVFSEFIQSIGDLFKSNNELSFRLINNINSIRDVVSNNTNSIDKSIELRDKVIIDMHKQITELELKVLKLESNILKKENKSLFKSFFRLFSIKSH